MSTFTMAEILMSKIAIKKQTNFIHGFLIDNHSTTIEFIDDDCNRFGPFALDLEIELDMESGCFNLRDDTGIQHECWIPCTNSLF